MAKLKKRPVPNANVRGRCRQCGRIGQASALFYKKQNGERDNICRECRLATVDNRNADTFEPILKEYNFPFIPNLWIQIAQTAYNKYPDKFDNTAVFGRYIRHCTMKPWIQYTYEDSHIASLHWAILNGLVAGDPALLRDPEGYFEEIEENYKDGNLTKEQYEELLRAGHGQATQIKDGECTTARWPMGYVDPAGPRRTNIPLIFQQGKGVPRATRDAKHEVSGLKSLDKALNDANRTGRKKDRQKALKDAASALQGYTSDVGGALMETVDGITTEVTPAAVEKDIAANLSEQDIRYLLTKWGKYTPTEWIRMEDMYDRYSNEYEIDVDREFALIQMCKTTIKMEQALADDNVQDYANYSKVLDNLRKSGKFTEAQKKTEDKRSIDSIGELVKVVEETGGIIPKFDFELNYNKDKADFTLDDIKMYINNLVKNELGLGSIIERYVKRLEEAEKDSKGSSMSEILALAGLEDDDQEATALREETANEIAADMWKDNLDNNVSDDINRMYEILGEPVEEIPDGSVDEWL